MRQVVLDTETTGLLPEAGHRIVEIGCVEILDRSLGLGSFQCYVNPGRPSDVDAVGIHGLTEAFLADKPTFSEVAEAFLTFIGDDELVIHNISFDLGFLHAEFARLGVSELHKLLEAVRKKQCATALTLNESGQPRLGNPCTDTMEEARRNMPGQNRSLDRLCDHYGIDRSEREHKGHGALLDARLLAEVWLAMQRGQSEMEFDEYQETTAARHRRLNAEIPVIRASAEELQMHRDYNAAASSCVRSTTALVDPE